jgi:hypothetical protein
MIEIRSPDSQAFSSKNAALSIHPLIHLAWKYSLKGKVFLLPHSLAARLCALRGFQK